MFLNCISYYKLGHLNWFILMLFVWKMWIISSPVMSSRTLYLANISLLQCLDQIAVWVFCVPPDPRVPLIRSHLPD